MRVLTFSERFSKAIMRIVSQSVAGGIAIASSIALAACDTLYYVSARTPLVTPLDVSCLRSTLGQITGREIRYTTSGEGTAHTFESRGGPKSQRRGFTQRIQPDGGVQLGTGVSRFNRPYRPGEADTLGSLFATLLRGMRDSCGGQTPPTKRALVVFAANDPTYEMWSVPGTEGRVLARWTVENRRWRIAPISKGPQELRLDTLADRSPPGYLGYLRADVVQIPRPPAGYYVATECRRGGSLAPGLVVAVVRGTNTAFHNDVVDVWDLDGAVARILPGRPAGVRCGNPAWSTTLPLATWEQQAAALTFTPSPGRARIYAYRSGDGKGLVTLNVAIDAQIVGRLASSTVVMVDVPPGRHSISSPGEKERYVWLDAMADSAYFVRMWPRLSVSHPRAGIEMMSAADARTEILSAQLVRSR